MRWVQTRITGFQVHRPLHGEFEVMVGFTRPYVGKLIRKERRKKKSKKDVKLKSEKVKKGARKALPIISLYRRGTWGKRVWLKPQNRSMAEWVGTRTPISWLLLQNPHGPTAPRMRLGGALACAHVWLPRTKNQTLSLLCLSPQLNQRAWSMGTTQHSPQPGHLQPVPATVPW